MKRIGTSIIAVVLAFSFLGCGVSTSEEVNSSLNEAKNTLSEARKEVEEAVKESGIKEDINEAVGEAKESLSEAIPGSESIIEKINIDPEDVLNSTSSDASSLLSTINASSYEDIYNEYSAKLTEAGEKLLEEYKTEAAKNSNGIEGLAEIANEKVSELADIEVEGTEAMAQFMYTKGAGKYEDYNEWATKLYSVYDSESQKIYKEYLSSVQ